jgi:chromosome partitioning protein
LKGRKHRTSETWKQLRTLAVIALKGGSGKTTVATHMALAAHRRGVDTLVVDMDRQCSAQNILAARADPGPTCVTASGAQLMSTQLAAVGLGKELLVVDTQAGAVEDAGEAIVLADLAIMVVRPTLLDLAGLAPTLQIVSQLKKPSIVVVNQAPVAREGVEAPLVKRALRALDYMRATVAPTILRYRTIYQTALETGRSAEEMWDPAAKREVATLWKFVDAAVGAAAGGARRS